MLYTFLQLVCSFVDHGPPIKNSKHTPFNVPSHIQYAEPMYKGIAMEIVFAWIQFNTQVKFIKLTHYIQGHNYSCNKTFWVTSEAIYSIALLVSNPNYHMTGVGCAF